MHEQLQDVHRATVSEAAVRRYVAHLRGVRAREAYVPLEFIPGSMMQVDFGHAEVILAGVRQSLPFIALRLMASTVSFAKMFAHEQLEAWLDGVVSGLSTTALTTNLAFAQWPQLFGDETMTVALLDRLTHRCHVLAFNGESYRMRESRARAGLGPTGGEAG